MVAVFGLVLSLGVGAHAAEKIQFQNWWVWQPNTSPFWLAIDSGFYKEEGLDVNYVEGKGSSYAIQAVGAKKADIGVSDLGTAAFGISKKTPIKAIFSFLQSGPQAVISHRETGIKKPKDVEGKRLAFGPADSGWILFPAFASANGIDMSKIIQVSAGPASMPQLLLAKKVDAILNYFTSVPEMTSQGADLTYLRYSDYKVSLLGGGLIAHTQTIKNRGAMLRKFIKATTKGFAEALKDPEKSIDMLMKRAPMIVSKKKIAIENLKMSLSLLHTERSKGKPIGWMASEDWENTIRLLAKYREMKPLAADRYYSNAFFPENWSRCRCFS
jgi:NitT/TauT family transport system substrate-binding protein